MYYIDQRFTWHISKLLVFSECYQLIGNIDKSSDYRWMPNLGLDFKINAHLAFRIDYQQKYYNLPPDFVQDRDKKQGVLAK